MTRFVIDAPVAIQLAADGASVLQTACYWPLLSLTASPCGAVT